MESAQAQRAEHARELAVAGDLGFGLAEGDVVPEVRVDVASLRVGAQAGLAVGEHGQAGVVGVLHDQLADQAVQAGAYLVDVAYLVEGDQRDLGPPPRRDLHQALPLQGQQRLAYGGAAAAVAARQVDGVEVGAGRQLADDDLPRDVLDDVVDEGGVRPALAEQRGEHPLAGRTSSIRWTSSAVIRVPGRSLRRRCRPAAPPASAGRPADDRRRATVPRRSCGAAPVSRSGPRPRRGGGRSSDSRGTALMPMPAATRPCADW